MQQLRGLWTQSNKQEQHAGATLTMTAGSTYDSSGKVLHDLPWMSAKPPSSDSMRDCPP